MDRKRIVLCGGGTAGHVMPNLALVPYLKDNFDIFYIGGGGMEREILKNRTDISYHEINAVKLRRDNVLSNAKLIYTLPRAVREAKKLLEIIEPDVIFSKGGYAALPVVLGAGKIPVVAHESDRTLGLANRLCQHKCKVICTSFEIKGNKTVQTGCPLRRELYSGNPKAYTFDNCKPTLLVLGGSQGALALNNVVSECFDYLTDKFNVIHITGKGKSTIGKRDSYIPIEFTDNIADCYACSDLALTRGGANVLFELCALKIPALIVPLEKASRGDQIENAEYFAEQGFACVLRESELCQNTLAPALESVKDGKIKAALLRSPTVDGCEKICSVLNRISDGKRVI